MTNLGTSRGYIVSYNEHDKRPSLAIFSYLKGMNRLALPLVFYCAAPAFTDATGSTGFTAKSQEVTRPLTILPET